MPIAILGTNPSSIAVHPTQPFWTLNELVAYAKSNPGKLSYGSSGVGTLNHLVGERLKLLTGTDIAHIPYRGAGPAMADLISGHVPMLVHGINGQAIELHRTGKVRILAVTGATRLAGAPDMPAGAEEGAPRPPCSRGGGISRPGFARLHRPLCAEGDPEHDRR